jgi:hypothetical protein
MSGLQDQFQKLRILEPEHSLKNAALHHRVKNVLFSALGNEESYFGAFFEGADSRSASFDCVPGDFWEDGCTSALWREGGLFSGGHRRKKRFSSSSARFDVCICFGNSQRSKHQS